MAWTRAVSAANLAALVPPLLPLLLRLLAVLGCVLPSIAAEPLLRPHDVIAFVGGEDMVAMSEYGYLELLLTRALPEHQLRFRNLAWEGDTVFEQRRDLNFPPLEAQLDKVGATVVIAQFGQMESLGKGGSRKAEVGSGAALKAEVAEFIAAYEKLIERLTGNAQRRVVLITPVLFVPRPNRAGSRDAVDTPYSGAVLDFATTKGMLVIPLMSELQHLSRTFDRADDRRLVSRDGIHFNDHGHLFAAAIVAQGLVGPPFEGNGPGTTGWMSAAASDLIRPSLEVANTIELIRAKNRLWFHYWRPQNWAFLNGDRINQPSSRDHLDPSKRWFPAEVEEFIPLIEAKEREIDAVAQKLAKP